MRKDIDFLIVTYKTKRLEKFYGREIKGKGLMVIGKNVSLPENFWDGSFPSFPL